MKKQCTKYTLEEISRFIDNELPQDQHAALAKHHVHCPYCNQIVEQYQSITDVYKEHLNRIPLEIDTLKIKEKFGQTLKNSKKKSKGSMFGFFGKYIYLKLASITAIVMIGLYTFQGGFFDPSGPSAIVKSVDTDFASVMIIETQKEKHTIIWFSET